MMEGELLEGGCACGAVRYRMVGAPMVVHCCHCLMCQRQSGSAFALNAMIEADRVLLCEGEPELVSLATPSGRGQRVSRCPACQVAVWSTYGGVGERARFIRVGTLDRPDLVPPDIHIWTVSKQPWVVLPDGAPAVEGFYDRAAYWTAASLDRLRALMAASGQDAASNSKPS